MRLKLSSLKTVCQKMTRVLRRLASTVFRGQKGDSAHSDVVEALCYRWLPPRWVPKGWTWGLSWELIAVGVTGIYSFVYYWKAFLVAREDPRLGDRRGLLALLGALSMLSVVLLVVTGISVWHHFAPPSRARLLLGVLVAFALYDLIVAAAAARGSALKRRFLASFLYVELPATIAILVIWHFVKSAPPASLTIADGFTSGAIAFQLLVGTTVYALIQGRDWGSICFPAEVTRQSADGPQELKRATPEVSMVYLGGVACRRFRKRRTAIPRQAGRVVDGYWFGCETLVANGVGSAAVAPAIFAIERYDVRNNKRCPVGHVWVRLGGETLCCEKSLWGSS